MSKINKDLLQTYFTFDSPIDFNGLKIYPIKLVDWITFASCASILDLEKNNTQDVKVIQMNYLKWLIIESLKEIQLEEKYRVGIMQKLYKVLELCFHTDNINLGFFDSDGEELYEDNMLDGNPVLIIDDKKITHRDFDKLRKIIMYQNLPYYDDTYINPNVKKALEEYERIVNKDIEYPSLERQIVIVANERGIQEKEIYEMTYRKFCMALSEINNKIEYQINKTAESSGMVKFKQSIDHWIYKKKRSRFGDKIVGISELSNKINSI